MPPCPSEGRGRDLGPAGAEARYSATASRAHLGAAFSDRGPRAPCSLWGREARTEWRIGRRRSTQAPSPIAGPPSATDHEEQPSATCQIASLGQALTERPLRTWPAQQRCWSTTASTPTRSTLSPRLGPFRPPGRPRIRGTMGPSACFCSTTTRCTPTTSSTVCTRPRRRAGPSSADPRAPWSWLPSTWSSTYDRNAAGRHALTRRSIPTDRLGSR